LLYDDGDEERDVEKKNIRRSSVGTETIKFAKGDKVEGNFRGRGRWLAAKITYASRSGTFDLLYDDGDEERDVEKKNIRAIGGSAATASAISFARGDAVEANYKGKGKWFSGKISAVNRSGTYDVRYDDGDEENGIRSDNIRQKHHITSVDVVDMGESGKSDRNVTPTERQVSVDSESTEFCKGAHIEANYRNEGIWFNGVIQRCNEDETCYILFDDGDREDGVSITRVAQRLVSGDRVVANFRGQGQWYPGRITTLNADGSYAILFEDGDVDPAVPRLGIQRPSAVAAHTVDQVDADEVVTVATVSEETPEEVEKSTTALQSNNILQVDLVNAEHDALQGNNTSLQEAWLREFMQRLSKRGSSCPNCLDEYFVESGGAYIIAPSYATVTAELKLGQESSFVAGIRSSDFVYPVCPDGTIYSQVMHALVSRIQSDTLNTSSSRTMPPHGGEGGFDSYLLPRDVTEANFSEYVHHPIRSQTQLQRTFAEVCSSKWQKRFGADEATGKEINPNTWDEHQWERLSIDRADMHRFFNREYYRRLPQHGKHRMIFICFGLSAAVVSARLAEVARCTDGNCEDMYLIIVPWEAELASANDTAGFDAVATRSFLKSLLTAYGHIFKRAPESVEDMTNIMEDGKFHVRIMNAGNGNSVDYMSVPTSTIATMKSEAEFFFGIPSRLQILIYNKSNLLDDAMDLSALGLLPSRVNVFQMIARKDTQSVHRVGIDMKTRLEADAASKSAIPSVEVVVPATVIASKITDSNGVSARTPPSSVQWKAAKNRRPLSSSTHEKKEVFASTLIQGDHPDLSVAAAGVQLMKEHAIADTNSMTRLCRGRPVAQQEMLQRAWASFDQLCTGGEVQVKHLPRILTALLGGQPPPYLKSEVRKFRQFFSSGTFTFFDFVCSFGFVLDGVSYEVGSKAATTNLLANISTSEDGRSEYLPLLRKARGSAAETKNPDAGMGMRRNGSDKSFALSSAVEFRLGSLGTWTSGRITAVARDGTYDIRLDSGEMQHGVRASFVRAMNIVATKQAESNVKQQHSRPIEHRRRAHPSDATQVKDSSASSHLGSKTARAKLASTSTSSSSSLSSSSSSKTSNLKQFGPRTTTMSSAPGNKASTVVLTDASAFSPGDGVEIGSLPAIEQRLIAGVDVPNSCIYLSWPLQNRYRAGNIVKRIDLSKKVGAVRQLAAAATLWVAATLVNEIIHQAATLGEASLRTRERLKGSSTRRHHRSVITAVPTCFAERPRGSWFGVLPTLGQMLVLRTVLRTDEDGVDRAELKMSCYNESRGFDITMTLRQLFAKCGNCDMMFDHEATCSVDLLTSSLLEHSRIGHLLHSLAPVTANATRTFQDAFHDLHSFDSATVTWAQVCHCFRESNAPAIAHTCSDNVVESGNNMRAESRQILWAAYNSRTCSSIPTRNEIHAIELDAPSMLDVSWKLDCEDLSATDLDDFFVHGRLGASTTLNKMPTSQRKRSYSFTDFVSFRFHRARCMLSDSDDPDPWIVESVAVFGRVEVALVRLRQLFDELLMRCGVDCVEDHRHGNKVGLRRKTVERAVPTRMFVTEALSDGPLHAVRYPELDSALQRLGRKEIAPLRWSSIVKYVEQHSAEELIFQNAPRSVDSMILPSAPSAGAGVVCEIVAESQAERIWIVSECGTLRCWDCQIERVVVEFNVFDANEQARRSRLANTATQLIAKPSDSPFVAVNMTESCGKIGMFDARSGACLSRVPIRWPSYDGDAETDHANVVSFALDWVRDLLICALLSPAAPHNNNNQESNIIVYTASGGIAVASFDVPAETRGNCMKILYVPRWLCLVAANDAGMIAFWQTEATFAELHRRFPTSGEGHGFSLIRGECSQVRHDHSSAITSLVYLPVGKLVASASLDGTVRLWDITARRATAPSLEHDFTCKLVLRPSEANLDNDLKRPSLNGSVCTRLSVESICVETRGSNIYLDPGSEKRAKAIDRQATERGKKNFRENRAPLSAKCGGFVYLLESGELFCAASDAFDPRFVLLNSARPPPQVRNNVRMTVSHTVESYTSDDLRRVLSKPTDVVRVFYIVMNDDSSSTLNLNDARDRLDDTKAAAGTQLEMESALPTKIADFVCFYRNSADDGPKCSLESLSLQLGERSDFYVRS
jgi:hypothetical protein